jgi:hypothetical protein
VPHDPPQVVPIGVVVGEADGHRLVLVSLEVWPDWADLRFARMDVGASRPLARRVPPASAWRVTADGRALEVVDAVGRGDRGFSNGEVRLAPSPAMGSTLTVEVELAPGAHLGTTIVLGAPVHAGPTEEDD